MNVVGALKRIDSLKIQHVTDHMIFVRNAVAAVNITRRSGNIQSFPRAVPL
jgi:hypothetical protein